ncbi:Glyoxalase/Bleomycin resistance protein/Dioxygenase superfamily protein [Duganella sp. CF458]|uniref:VOC family protein n=1 Tax=Duganella sp. CF458 TaxID=1884368 RepID=UPI0008E138B5|nr:VOC family protein [Duganella sp. CF458]SFG58256.1 Glyoxalase/Bleomycin resistance protein/Dioxygenase superfamily protein [Duganella sp. CF458]
MLADIDAIAMIAVKDLAAAAKFYGEVLGLEKLGSPEQEVLIFRSGASKINVYRSAFAGTNKATCVMWNTGGELEAVAARLKAQGVQFEHYDTPGLTREGDIHVGGQMKVAWFKDVDGNILSIVSG